MRWYGPWLYPFALLYDGVTKFRNKLFDWQFKKSRRVSVPVVVVGNLNVGGSGKTPMVEFLVEALADRYQTVTLSRGYGRKTRGFLLADGASTPSEIGDEPFQVYSKYRNRVSVAVGERRLEAVEKILHALPATELLILDDAFQHRYIQGDFQVLLTTYQEPFFRDFLLPSGTLRESRSGARRSDIIVVTKCPEDMKDAERDFFRKQIGKWADAPVLFAGLGYGEAQPLFPGQAVKPSKVILMSGIADNRLFRLEAASRYDLVEVLDFSDHYSYGIADIKRLSDLTNKHPGACVLTTEKDAVKLKNPLFREYLSEIPIFALPVKVKLSEADKTMLLDGIVAMIEEKPNIREV